MPGIGTSRHFTFEGGAGMYLGPLLLSFVITICTLGIAYPYALVLQRRWVAKHTFIDGHQLAFTGTGIGLFGTWLKWLALTVIPFGIYLFWVVPRLHQWVVEHTDFADASVVAIGNRPAQLAATNRVAIAPSAAIPPPPRT